MANIKFIGTAQLSAAFDKFDVNIDEAISDAIRITAFKVQRNAIKSIKNPSIGKQVTRYTASGNGYKHTVSKPGDAPNSDTGRLIGAIDVDYNRGDMDARVIANTKYALYLETVLNRPFLEPAKQDEIKSFDKNIEQAIDLQIRKAGK